MAVGLPCQKQFTVVVNAAGPTVCDQGIYTPGQMSWTVQLIDGGTGEASGAGGTVDITNAGEVVFTSGICSASGGILRVNFGNFTANYTVGTYGVVPYANVWVNGNNYFQSNNYPFYGPSPVQFPVALYDIDLLPGVNNVSILIINNQEGDYTSELTGGFSLVLL